MGFIRRLLDWNDERILLRAYEEAGRDLARENSRLFIENLKLKLENERLRAANQLNSELNASISGENTENVTSKGDIYDFVASELRGDAE